MKAFSKWWEEEGFYFEYEAMCEVAWRAALERLLKDLDTNSLLSSTVKRYIEKELEE